MKPMLMPKGIRKKKKKTIQISASKKHFIDGKEKVVRKTEDFTIKLNKNYTQAEYDKALQVALQEAIKGKVLLDQQVSSTAYANKHTGKVLKKATLNEAYNSLFPKQWAGKPQEANVCIYAKDIFNYFPRDILLEEMQTSEHYEGFVDFCREQILARPMNNNGTVSNNSINKRLGVIRDILRYGIKERMLDQSKLLNPDIRKNDMGWENLPSGTVQTKAIYTQSEFNKIIAALKGMGQYEYADAAVWLYDTGMRIKGEYDAFTIDKVNFSRKTIQFLRPKTGVQSVEIPLSNRALAIVKARKEVAMQRGGKVFTTSYNQMRTLIKKVLPLVPDVPQNGTPYSFRHCFITNLVEAGVPPKTTQDLAGHSKIETTLTYYAKSTNKSLQDAIAAISADADENSMIGHNSRVLKIKAS